MEITQADKEKILSSINNLDIFAWCMTCETLLIGSADHSSYWGSKVSEIAQMHRNGTRHDVYVGGIQDIKEA